MSDDRSGPTHPVRMDVERKLALAAALLERKDAFSAASARLASDLPEAHRTTRDAIAFHLYQDGAGALLDVLAAAELYLRGEGPLPDGALVHHALYHLYGFQTCAALAQAPLGDTLDGVREALACLKDDDAQGARGTLEALEERLAGHASPPGD